MQEQILFFFQLHSNPFWDHLFEIFSILGEDLVIISILAWIYWNISKQKGFIIALTMISSVVLNNLLKIVFRRPRPYEVFEKLKGKRINTATGYSFPSGHTQGAATFYISLSLLFRKYIIGIVSVLIVLAVGLSRVYLAVHWPIDILASLILGSIISITLVNYLFSIIENSGKKISFIKFVNSGALLVLASSLLIKTFLFKGDLLTDDLVKSIALLNGVSLGFFLDLKREKFTIKSVITLKILRFLIGMTGAFVIITLSKSLLPQGEFWDYFRYFSGGFWVVYLYPLLAVKCSLFESSESNLTVY